MTYRYNAYIFHPPSNNGLHPTTFLRDWRC